MVELLSLLTPPWYFYVSVSFTIIINLMVVLSTKNGQKWDFWHLTAPSQKVALKKSKSCAKNSEKLRRSCTQFCILFDVQY